jgi:hypothetical protein
MTSGPIFAMAAGSTLSATSIFCNRSAACGPLLTSSRRSLAGTPDAVSAHNRYVFEREVIGYRAYARRYLDRNADRILLSFAVDKAP